MAKSQEDKKLERYQVSVPDVYQLGANTFVTALVKALAQSDADIEVMIGEANDQLFTETADKQFLDALGSNVGVRRPPQVNLDDDKFRDLIPALSYRPKQVRRTMYDVLDVFYGPLYSRANIQSYAKQPFNLGAPVALTGNLIFQNNSPTVIGNGTFFLSELVIGDWLRFIDHGNEFFLQVASIPSDNELRLSQNYQGGGRNLSFDGTGLKFSSPSLSYRVDSSEEIVITLPPTFMQDTTNITAEEMVNAINSQTQTSADENQITASVIEDPINDEFFVNVRTDTPGSTGSIEMTGGTANKFSLIQENNQGNTIIILKEKAAQYEVGDIVVAGSKNLGSLDTEITNIELGQPVDEFARITVDNPAVATFTEADGGYIYTKGDLGIATEKKLVTQLDLATIIYETSPKELTVKIPATVPALRRTLRGSTHPRGNFSGEIVFVDEPQQKITVNMDDFINEDVLANTRISSNFGEIPILSNTAGQNGVVLTMDPQFDLSVVPRPVLGVGSIVIDPNNKFKFTGTGTQFLTDFEEGSVILIGNQRLEIAHVNSDTEIITCTPFQTGLPNIQEIDLRGDTAADLGGKYFQLFSANDDRVYRIWYNVNMGNVAPVNGLPGSIDVQVNINLGWTNQQVAQATLTQLSAIDDFNVTNPYLGRLRVENKLGGETTPAQDGVSPEAIEGTFRVITKQKGRGNSADVVAGADYFVSPDFGYESFTILSDNYISAYAYDPENSAFTATSVKCELKQIVNKGVIEPTITVEGAGDFPNDVGFLVFDFGRRNEEVPVRYRGRPNNNTLLIDPAYVFKLRHEPGEQINLITDPVLGTTPNRDGTDYPSFVTGLAEARQAVEDLIRAIKAAGVAVKFIIDVPDYLWTTGWDPLEDI